MKDRELPLVLCYFVKCGHAKTFINLVWKGLIL